MQRNITLGSPSQDRHDRQMNEQKATSRDGSIEALRIIAAFGIVWYHAAIPYSPIAYAGLPIFIMITFYFQGLSSRGDIALNTLAIRILRPWVIWMVILAVYNVVRHKALLSTGRYDLSSLLYGSYPHLWYLPFIFVSIIAVRALRKVLPDIYIWSLSAGTAVIFLLAVPTWRPASMAAGVPIAQYAQASGAIAIGLLFAAARKSLIWIIPLAVIGGAAVYAALLPFSAVGTPYVVAIALFSVAVVASKIMGPARYLEPLTKLTFGIYLVHPPILGILRQGARLDGPLLVLAAFLASALFVYVLRATTGEYITPR
jgi:peptidoglycan/LPS O-acetylase OafA/YrhL